MSQDDVTYVLELLNDAIECQDWDSVKEARQYLNDFVVDKKNSKYDDDE